ncbi:DUF4389 domain-containing protein [Desulfonema ishimotonii]|uniref:DUF4389 domain-containing protein n=1 Tax=Desulfonema ishimotonii TaxID=45657 RepID=A0A401FSD6_9BACT|nr:DUF4389 domain-containing protein [Desulfonema ishimotonii]GBC59892.1 DUF4389 domain-containing protein [Desulfonema ishimotonii]
MNQVKKLLSVVTDKALRFIIARKNVGVRLVFTLFFTLVCGMLSFAILALAFLQFVCLLITMQQNEAIKGLSHKLTAYTYKVLRYITLTENLRPYPFSPFPSEMEPAEVVDLSAPVPEKDAFTADTDSAPAADADKAEEKAADDATADSEPIIPDHKES